MPPDESTQKTTDVADTGKDIDHSFTRLASRPGFLIRRLHQIHGAMFFEECQTRKATPVQFAILSVVLSQPGLDQTSLGKEVGLDRTTATDVIKRLAQRGLLQRNAHASDKRMRQLYATPEGATLVAELRDGMARAQERLLAPLRPAERVMFMDLMSILVDANQHYGSPMRVL